MACNNENVLTKVETIDCVSITICVQDQYNKPVDGYTTNLHIHGDKYFIFPKDRAFVDGKVTASIKKSNITSYVLLYGPNAFRTSIRTKFNQNGVYKFVIVPCADQPEPAPKSSGSGTATTNSVEPVELIEVPPGFDESLE